MDRKTLIPQYGCLTSTTLRMVFSDVWMIDGEVDGYFGELLYMSEKPIMMYASEMCRWGNEGVSKRGGIGKNLGRWKSDPKSQYGCSRDKDQGRRKRISKEYTWNISMDGAWMEWRIFRPRAC